MTKKYFYRYLGENGVIDSIIHIQDSRPLEMVCLSAEEGYLLTDGKKEVSSIFILVENESDWIEIVDENYIPPTDEIN